MNKLDEIVPEYKSENVFIRNIFNRRIFITNDFIYKCFHNECTNILDVGCGNGILSKSLAPNKNYNILAIDSNINLNNKIYSSNLKFKNENILGISYKNKFDCVCALDVLEHIKNIQTAITKIKNSIRGTGLLITSQPTESFFYKIGRLLIKGTTDMSVVGHYYTSKQITDNITINGFRLLERRGIYFLCFKLFDICVYEKII